MKKVGWKHIYLALRRNPFTDGQPSIQLIWLYTIALAGSFFLLSALPVAFSNDSMGYVEAGKVFANGEIDILRTPFYSLFCHSLLGLPFLGYKSIIICQYLLFLLSVQAFYHIARWMIHTPALRFIVSLAYILHPGIILWHGMILTESLAISGAIFLVYFMLCYNSSPSWKSAIAVGITFLTLLALRPSSIYLSPALGVFVGWALWKHRKYAGLLLAGCLLAALCTWSYCYAYQRKFGVFMPGYVTSLNQYWILRNTGIMQPSDSEDTDIRRDLEQYITEEDTRNGEAFYNEFFFFIDTYGVERTHRLVQSSLEKHRVAYLSVLLKQAVETRNFPAFTYYIDAETMPLPLRLYVKLIFGIFTFHFHFIYLFLTGYAVAAFLWMKRHSRISIMPCCLWMIVGANVSVSVFAAMGEWHRLIVPSMPLLFLMMAKAIDYCCVNKGYRSNPHLCKK